MVKRVSFQNPRILTMKANSFTYFFCLALFASVSPAAEGPSPKEIGYPSFLSPHASPIAIHDDRVFVVNTPSDTVDVIDASTREIVARVDVGIDPVSIAVRPDGAEVWVSNHVSDSVSVIDNDPESSTYLHVIATIQEFDPKSKATRFDEPVGIAFANNDKAYVALSSENQIAVINVAERKVMKRLTITAQDPRAIAVRGDRLYVIPFESNNKTQLSGGAKDDIDGELITFDAWEHSIRHNNVLSLGHVTDIVKHPRVPDRDLFVFDTETDELVRAVDTLGTLLYGLTVDSKGRVFIAQADARNDVNGRSGTKKHGLAEMENRAFLNQITVAPAEGEASFIELEPLPPQHPEPNNALATPFAIEISDNDSLLVATAASSDKVFTIDAESGEVLGSVRVGSVPRGIALDHSSAWVLNAVANTVSFIDLSNPRQLKVEDTIVLNDPTHPAFKRGRIAFNSAHASTTRTFSCASCHPDGHTDQLLWVLKTPIVSGGDQIMPRSTMPIRGLRDTAPFHWDGIPGDPYGGSNSANVRGHVEPNSDPNDPESAARHLIDGGLAGTMAMVGAEGENDEGKPGLLSADERDDMAKFLLGVTYPPAQRRAFTNELSDRAEEGFELFHLDGNFEGRPQANVCGNCHRMPFWVSTNTPGSGMDAPTWRGAYDRFLILPQGRLNIIDFPFYESIAKAGNDERSIWRLSWRSKPRFDPVWDMVLEGSTGFSGSFARQVTLNRQTAKDSLSDELLDALETSAIEGGVVLQCEGVLNGETMKLQFAENEYVAFGGENEFSRQQLLDLAKAGDFIGTFTGRHGANADYDHPQPALWTLSSLHEQSGRQKFPILHKDQLRMEISGRHIREGAHIVVNGRRTEGVVEFQEDDRLTIELATLPPIGTHFLQLQNPDGLFSNDFIFHVVPNAEAVAEFRRQQDQAHEDSRTELAEAAATGNLERIKTLLKREAKINARKPDGGSTALSEAALHGRLDAVKLLLDRGAKVDATNEDGNTPLHVAAFLCEREIVQQLLKRGAPIQKKNNRGETTIDVVSSEWSQGLADFYRGIGSAIGREFDLEHIQRERPEIAKMLREHESAN